VSGPVAVLGANGFVGRRVVRDLQAAGLAVRPVVRSEAARATVDGPDVHVHVLGPGGWEAALEGCDSVVHLVARTHQLHEAPGPSLERAYREVNVDLTRDVLQAAQAAGLRRVVYMSSIKAMGESRSEPYTETDRCRPQDAYGRTKLAAEQLVQASLLEHVVLRPPLVYGPGAAGNVSRLVTALRRGLPLPLGRADARRSLIAVANLADAVRAVLAAPQPPRDVYLVADAEVLSVRELVEALAAGVGRPARLLPAPGVVLRGAGRLLGRSDEVDRLLRPLVLDTSRLRRELDWAPPMRAADALREVAAAHT
jgi:nucleoside-diphosphate-sugar epimerase